MGEERTTWTRPLAADLTRESTREEVFAAVEDFEARIGDALACGSNACRRGPRRSEVEPLLQRQQVAGEEDQSVPGWDQGA